MNQRTETMVRTSWTMVRKSGPKVRLMTEDQLKRKIRLSLDDDSHDQTLLELIDAATGQVEHDCSLALVDQEWTYMRDEFNARYRYFDLPIRTATSIVEISFNDAEGNPAVMDPADYVLDSGRNQVRLAFEKSWPEVASSLSGNITVSFRAGWDSPENVPAELIQAVALQAGKWFQNPTMDMPSMLGDEAYDRLVGRYMRSDYP